MSVDPESRFKYRAFLSYRSADSRQAEWLHRKLEEYRVPRSLVGTRIAGGLVPRRLGRIFRDRDEARSAERIESANAAELSESQHLIVLCTPAAVAPDSWVPREICALSRAQNGRRNPRRNWFRRSAGLLPCDPSDENGRGSNGGATCSRPKAAERRRRRRRAERADPPHRGPSRCGIPRLVAPRRAPQKGATANPSP
jgi:hypothetical protein